ncbi:MAG: hypothetical protein ACR2QE_06430 [Acidimicrobiales bacterium]
MPPATHGHLAKLPDSARTVHDAWMRRDRDLATGHARQLASSLVEVTDSPDQAEHVLQQLRIAPATAHDAVAWARAQRDHPSGGPEAA